MKNFANPAAGTFALLPDPLTLWARQLMTGTMRIRRSVPPVVVSMPLTLLAAAHNGAPFSPFPVLPVVLAAWLPDQSLIRSFAISYR